MSSTRIWKLLSALVLGLTLIPTLWPKLANAQSCSHNCPKGEKDARGCCIPLGGMFISKDGFLESRPVETCGDGRIRNKDTQDHCCWPSQVWAGKACTGRPECPLGYEISDNSCRLLSCPAPKVRLPNDKAACCYPGQTWSSLQALCVGKPKNCPSGFEVSNDGCIFADRDGDGLVGTKDQCPDEPEDADGFEDDDGCPDKDNDRDGILDFSDRCRDQPEDANGFMDDDGCPDEGMRLGDSDRDGVVNQLDRCPDDKEDQDGFEDSDGCPDPDNDYDGFPDNVDKCRNQPEDKNGFQDGDGCPDATLLASEQQKRRRFDSALAQWSVDKNAASTRRTWGIVTSVASGGFAAGSITFAALRQSRIDDLAAGNFATRHDMSAAVDEANMLLVGAIVLGVFGTGSLGAAIPLLATSGEPAKPTLGLVVTPDGGALKVMF